MKAFLETFRDWFVMVSLCVVTPVFCVGYWILVIVDHSRLDVAVLITTIGLAVMLIALVRALRKLDDPDRDPDDDDDFDPGRYSW